LNILEAEQKKTAPAQTWESEGFRPAREPRGDRPRREEFQRDEPRREERAPREESAPVDIASIPEKFLYVRPGYNYVPTPSNYGGAPRERGNGGSAAPARSFETTAAAPAKSGGFLGWLKSLFGGSSAAAPAPVEAHSGEHRHGDRHRGGRGRGQGGGDGQRRRSRGGRGRSGGGYRGERSGGAQGGDVTG
jgi:translation initiation factor IF-2